MRISPWFGSVALVSIVGVSKPTILSRLEHTESNEAAIEIIQKKRTTDCRHAMYSCGMAAFGANGHNHGSHTSVLTEPTLWGDYTFVRVYQTQTGEGTRETTRFKASRTKLPSAPDSSSVPSYSSYGGPSGSRNKRAHIAKPLPTRPTRG